MKAWGDYINSQGGLACRKVVVKDGDSKLSPTDAANAIAAACGDSVALVGTTALFLQDVQRDGDRARTKPARRPASPISPCCRPSPRSSVRRSRSRPWGTRLVVPVQRHRPADVPGRVHELDYYFKKFGATALHGVFVIPKDLPSTIAATMPVIRAKNKMGIPSDAEFGMSGTAIQTDYTQVAQAMKAHSSTFARNGLDYKGTVLMRKEAQVQGVDTVKVWDCTLQCYDKRLIHEGGRAVEGQYVWLNFLPFEDKGSNPELDAFLKYDTTPDGFSAQAWIAGRDLRPGGQRHDRGARR